MKSNYRLTDEFTRMDEEIRKLAPKIGYSMYIFSFFFLIIACRLWYLQIYKGADLQHYSENNRLKKQTISAPRGLILSRDKKIIARNHLESELVFIPQHSKNIEETAQTIAPVMEQAPLEIFQKIQKSVKENGLFFPVRLKKNLNLKQVYQLKLLKTTFPELNIQEYMVRSYPLSFANSQPIGYIGEISKAQIKTLNNELTGPVHFQRGDQIGQSGIEEEWELDLKGQNGFSFIEVNAHNQRVIPSSQELWRLPSKKVFPGSNLILTLDTDIQQAAFSAMNRNDRIGPRTGAVVVMKTNGEILAWLSSPPFDSNLFSKTLSAQDWNQLVKDSSKSLLNRVIQSHYPPASTLKPLIATAALQENIIDKETLIESPSKIRLGRRVFHDHNKRGYGNINLTQALEQSSNTFFYKIGQQLGINQMAFYLSSFGLGKKTGIRINEEIPGFVPTSQWKLRALNEPWQAGEDFIHAIGQGYTLATPLQMAVAYNAIASEGLIVRPFLVQSIVDIHQKELKKFSSAVIDDLSQYIHKEHFQTIKQALYKVVHGERGTARWWKMKDYPMAGKTGTSQVRAFNQKELYKDCHKRPKEQRHHGWFVGFAPVEKPQITIAVLTENSCSGPGGSVPVARDIVRAYFKKYPIPQLTENKDIL